MKRTQLLVAAVIAGLALAGCSTTAENWGGSSNTGGGHSH